VDVKLRCQLRRGLSLSSIFEAKPIFEILGLLFDVSKTKANDAFNWIEILRDILPASQMEEVKRDVQKYKELPTTYGISINSR